MPTVCFRVPSFGARARMCPLPFAPLTTVWREQVTTSRFMSRTHQMMSHSVEPGLASGDAAQTFNLRDLGPLLVRFLDSDSRLQFRVACREGRAITDKAITTLSASRRERSAAPQPAAQFTAFVRSLLSRGSRPDKLLFHPDFADADGAGFESKVNANTAAAVETLAAFTQQRQALQQHQRPGPAVPFLTCLSLRDVAFTDALASAVHSAAPHLASLDIASDILCPDRLKAATPGLCRLIDTCTPTLTSLTFSGFLSFVPQPLADAITTCTSLQHLQVGIYPDPENFEEGAYEQDSLFRVAELAAALPSLRSLDFALESSREALEEWLEPLSRATGLTSLTLKSPVSITHLLTHVLRPMRGSLVRLSLHGWSLCEKDLRVLAAEYGQLTYFEFGSIQFDTLDLWLMDGARGSVPLPAALRELHFACGVEPWDLLALQLPHGLTRLSIDGLQCSSVAEEGDEPPDEDGDGAAGGDVPVSGSGSETSVDEQPGDGAAGEDAGAGMGDGSLRASAPSPSTGFDRLLEAVAMLYGRFDGSKGLNLQYEWGASPITWPAAAGDRAVRLFAALRPLGLRVLRLYDWALDVERVAALVEQLPDLEDLTLHCQLHPAAVPLLARLPHLRHLELQGRETDTWSGSETAVAAALLPLLLGAPCLQHLKLAVHWSSGDGLVAALREGVERVKEQLRGMGRDPGVVTVLPKPL